MGVIVHCVHRSEKLFWTTLFLLENQVTNRTFNVLLTVSEDTLLEVFVQPTRTAPDPTRTLKT